MARKQVELTIHQPGHKTEVDEEDLPNLRTQGHGSHGLLRTDEGGNELVEDVPEAAPEKPAAPKASGAPAAKPAPAKDGS